MYFFTLRVVPTADNPYFDRVEGAIVSCWALEEDPIEAVMKASFKVRQYNWSITAIESGPASVNERDFLGRELGRQQYKEAQKEGLSLFFTGWARDGKSSLGPIKLDVSDDFVLSSFLDDRKELRRKGRCLHFAAGVRCTEIINAHSIQRSKALSLIADRNEVYAPSMNMTDAKNGRGRVKHTRQPISKVSTFRGFCRRHDNDIFGPIDDFEFVPTAEQIFLYAFRSICKELFVKKNALSLERKYARKLRNKGTGSLFAYMAKGSAVALNKLNIHKRQYDACLKNKSFSDIEYATFYSTRSPSLAFSGLLSPDFDFLGNKLQNLTDVTTNWHLITFCFVPMQHGWAFLLAWCPDSSTSGIELFRSLATVVHEGKDLGDCLFRFVISNCENLAISPSWWESLTEEERSEVERVASYKIKMFSPVRPDYLVNGLEGISKWNFESVTTNIPPPTSD